MLFQQIYVEHWQLKKSKVKQKNDEEMIKFKKCIIQVTGQKKMSYFLFIGMLNRNLLVMDFSYYEEQKSLFQNDFVVKLLI